MVGGVRARRLGSWVLFLRKIRAWGLPGGSSCGGPFGLVFPDGRRPSLRSRRERRRVLGPAAFGPGAGRDLLYPALPVVSGLRRSRAGAALYLVGVLLEVVVFLFAVLEPHVLSVGILRASQRLGGLRFGSRMLRIAVLASGSATPLAVTKSSIPNASTVMVLRPITLPLSVGCRCVASERRGILRAPTHPLGLGPRSCFRWPGRRRGFR